MSEERSPERTVKRRGPRPRSGFRLFLLLAALGAVILFLARYWPGEAQAPAGASGKPAEETRAPVSEKASAVYALSEPLPPASGAEREAALKIVDYANAADQVLGGLCGVYPERLLDGVETYAEDYVLPKAGREPAADCARKALTPPAGLFGDEKELRERLEEIDAGRVAMGRLYSRLGAYAADKTIVDDGRLGRELSGEFRESHRRFTAAREAFLTRVRKAGNEAQEVLLRGHPLHDHVLLAAELAGRVERLTTGRTLDAAALDSLVNGLEEGLTRAERLPFPLPGEIEMHYRHFLRKARAVLAQCRRGREETFHSLVRRDLNEAWEACRAEYNAFVDAVARR